MDLLMSSFNFDPTQRGPSECPYLTIPELSFIRQLSQIAHNDMYKSCVEEYNDIRNRLIGCGYTDDLSERFLYLAKHPAELDLEFLERVLPILSDFFFSLSLDEEQRLAEIMPEYEQLDDVVYFGGTGRDGCVYDESECFPPAYINSAHELRRTFGECNSRIKDLRNRVRRIDMIANRPTTSNLLPFPVPAQMAVGV